MDLGTPGNGFELRSHLLLCHLRKLKSSSALTEEWSSYFPLLSCGEGCIGNMHEILCMGPDSELALNKQQFFPLSDTTYTLLAVPSLLFYSLRNIILHTKAGFSQLLCFFFYPPGSVNSSYTISLDLTFNGN